MRSRALSWKIASRRAASTLLLAGLLAAPGPLPASAEASAAAPPAASGAPAIGGAPARLAERETASEFWTLAGRFDTGHHLFAEITVTNLGVGDRNAAVVGHVVAPDGSLHPFRKAKREGRWSLSDDGLRLELGKLVFDQHGPVQSFEFFGRGDLEVVLDFELADAPQQPAPLRGPDHGFDLVGVTAPARGRIRLEGMARAVDVTGVLGLTHRWVDGVESGVTLRRIEFFSLGEGASLYYQETARPGGETGHWLALARDGRIVRETQDVVATLDFAESADSQAPIPLRLHLEGPDVSGTVDLREPLLSYDPLGELPALIRLAMGGLLDLRWRSAWAASPFELTWREAPGGASDAPEGTARPESLHLGGTGLAHVTYFQSNDRLAAASDGT